MSHLLSHYFLPFFDQHALFAFTQSPLALFLVSLQQAVHSVVPAPGALWLPGRPLDAEPLMVVSGHRGT